MNTLAIVVTYNDCNNVLKAVGSLIHQADVLVWDNGSTDSTVHALSKNFPQVKVHAHPTNLMWTPALNAATEQYWDGKQNLLYSNNDIVYQPNVVSILSEVLQDPQAGLVGPAGSGLGSAQDFAIWYGHQAPDYGQQITTAFRRYLTGLPTKRVPHIVGAAMMVQPSLRHQIGPFDNNMPMGADDHDYCIRTREAGYSVQVAYSAFVSHQSHASFRVARRVWDKYNGMSWDAFNQKWAGYFHNQEEAVKVQWGDEYFPGWDRGTGWLSPEERKIIWEEREE